MNQRRRRVALFITCLTDQFYPQVGVAVTKVLEHFGCDVVFPNAQTCCGQPFFNNGFHDDARELAKRFVATFEPFDQIVTPSASCCAMVREQFPTLLGEDHAWEHGMRHVSDRTFEFVEFLIKVLKVNLTSLSLPQPTPMTYHYTCHQRGLGIVDEPVQLLKQLSNLDLRPVENVDQCCGFGGTFAIKYPAISGVMADDKIARLAKTGATTTICNDAGCTMNLSGMCHRRGVQMQFKHAAELIAEALGLNVSRW
jgi:L-lactate dehydrogenase complex protein LldE